MVYLILSLILFTPALLGLGHLFKNFSLVQNLSGYLFIGILSVIFFWGILAFIMPIGIWVELLTLGFGILFFIKDRLYLLFGRVKLPLTFYLLALLILFSGTFSPFILDQFGYYVPTINWIKSAGWVEGVANIEWVLGQMSFWHLLEAGLSNFGDSFLRFNTLLLLYFLLYIYERQRFILLLILPFGLLFTQSPSPDLPVILLSLVFITEILNHNRNYQAIVLLGGFIFAIKPTMIWTPILALFYIISQKKFKFKILFPTILLGILFLLKNALVSGYLFFPTSILNFNFPWKPISANLESSNQFALMKSYDMLYSYSELIKADFLQRLKWWLFLPGIKGKINLFFLLSSILFLIFCLNRKSKLVWLIFISLAVKSVFVLSFSAQYRFLIDVLVIIYVVLFGDLKKGIKTYTILGSLITLSLLCLPKLFTRISPSFRLSQFMTGFQARQLLKPQHYVYQNYDVLNLGNVTFHITKDYPFIFDSPVPGITRYNLQQYLKTKTIPQRAGNGGFIPIPMDLKTRKQIEDFLNQR